MRDPAFWVVQAVVVALAVAHLVIDATHVLASAALPTGSPVALLLIPVLYAAVRYGLPGGAATALWATILWLPDLLLGDGEGHPVEDLINLGVVVGVAVFVGVLVERGAAQRQRTEAAEERERTSMRSYTARVVAAHEEERRHVAHEIHDDPLQRLIQVSRRVDGLVCGAAATRTTEALRAIREELLDVVRRLRDVARGLGPPGLEQLGLVAAVRGLLAEVEAANDASWRLRVSGAPVRRCADVELGAFRVIQEAVTNTTRHGHATEGHVSIRYAGTHLHVTVADDGVGFNADQATDPERLRLGLVGIRERARMLGGDFRVVSRPGRGTTVDVTLPVPPAETALAI